MPGLPGVGQFSSGLCLARPDCSCSKRDSFGERDPQPQRSKERNAPGAERQGRRNTTEGNRMNRSANSAQRDPSVRLASLQTSLLKRLEGKYVSIEIADRETGDFFVAELDHRLAAKRVEVVGHAASANLALRLTVVTTGGDRVGAMNPLPATGSCRSQRLGAVHLGRAFRSYCQDLRHSGDPRICNGDWFWRLKADAEEV